MTRFWTSCFLAGARFSVSWIGRCRRLNSSARVAAVLVWLCLAGAASADTQYWDTNNTAGLQGGTSTWDLTSTNWNDSTGSGTRTTWTNGNDAVFSATSTTTFDSPTTIVAGSITVNSGFALTMTDNGFDAGGAHPNTVDVTTVNLPGGATSVTFQAKMVGSHDLNLEDDTTSGANNVFVGLINGGKMGFTGSLNLMGNSTGITDWSRRIEIQLTQTNVLPDAATINFIRNWSQIAFTELQVKTFPNNIVLNPGSAINASSFVGMIGPNASLPSIADVNMTGQISGNGTLAFGVGVAGTGQGVITLSNNNTYTGNTQWIAGNAFALRLGIDNALPTTTGLVFGINAVNGGAFDMNGHDQTVASLSTSTSGTQQGGIVNNQAGGSPHTSVLTINGSATTSYSGPLGSAAFATNLPNTANHDKVKLVLASTNTGQQTLSRAAGEAYSGGTEINGGKLIVTNTSGSATGTGAVAVNSGGTLGGTGTIGGVVTVSGSGALSPGLPAAVGTLSMGAGLTLNDSNVLNYDFHSGSNDLLAITGNLSIPSTGGITFNLTDLDSLGIVAGNTYHLMTFTGALSAPSDLNTVMHTGTAPANSYSFVASGNFINLIVSAGAPGDLNGDGHVDAGDYVYWRKNGLPQSSYDQWRAHFGNPPGAGAGNGLGSNAVPEPAALSLVMFAVGAALIYLRGNKAYI
jgi:hypothetical protein